MHGKSFTLGSSSAWKGVSLQLMLSILRSLLCNMNLLGAKNSIRFSKLKIEKKKGAQNSFWSPLAEAGLEEFCNPKESMSRNESWHVRILHDQ